MNSNDNLFQKSIEVPQNVSTIAAQYSLQKDLKNKASSVSKFRRNRQGHYQTLALKAKPRNDDNSYWIKPKISMHTLGSEKQVLVNDRSISSEVQPMHANVEDNNSEVMTLDQSNLVVNNP